MLRYIVSRLGISVVMILLATVVIFLIVNTVPGANVYGVTRYGQILRSIGFADSSLRSIAEDVTVPYVKFMHGLLADPKEAGRFHPMIRRAMSAPNNPFAASDYILVTAAKPAAR